MSEGARQEEVGPEKKEYEEAANRLVLRIRVANKTDGVVPAKVHDDCHERVPKELDHDIGEDEHSPSIGFRWALARFEKIALGNEHGHDLLVDVDEEYEKHKHSPKLVLKPLNGVVGAVTEAEVQ